MSTEKLLSWHKIRYGTSSKWCSSKGWKLKAPGRKHPRIHIAKATQTASTTMLLPRWPSAGPHFPSFVEKRRCREILFDWVQRHAVFAASDILLKNLPLGAMNGENRQHTYRWTCWFWEIAGWCWRPQEITDHFSEIYGMYLKLIRKNWRIITCNRLDSEIIHYSVMWAFRK